MTSEPKGSVVTVLMGKVGTLWVEDGVNWHRAEMRGPAAARWGGLG